MGLCIDTNKDNKDNVYLEFVDEFGVLNNEDLLDRFEQVVDNLIDINNVLKSRDNAGRITKEDVDRIKNIWLNFQIKMLESLKGT